MKGSSVWPFSADALNALAEARHGDPFSVLGPHRTAEGKPAWFVVYINPQAQSVEVVEPQSHATLAAMEQIHPAGIFAARLNTDNYRLQVHEGGHAHVIDDPYRFPPLISDFDLHLFAEGRHRFAARFMGGQTVIHQQVAGASFSVWAPNAWAVSVIGDFNGWDSRTHPMRLRHSAGVWELFVPGLEPGVRYKFSIVDGHGQRLPDKADPYARQTEHPPATASVLASSEPFYWTDGQWIRARHEQQALNRPMSVYEVHAGSWLRDAQDPESGWSLLADRLVPYVAGLGFTHIELLPIMEHPFYGSWGYQPLSLFAPSARYGTPEAFAAFVDRCHAAGVGVIIDWVPAHFPSDAHGLARFDGTALYEYEDPKEGFHRDWNTLIYNVGRNEVRGFLISSAVEWLEHFHIDGLRVDAVASMLYRDYSRGPGEWIPNRYGGRENLEVIDFFRELNTVVAETVPGAVVIAEESTAFPGVTAPTGQGGLGFTYKWNMGWMHDTLEYMEKDPIYRPHHHNQMSFGLVYAFSERFVLPLSHDEVVYGKGSLLTKMPGDRWQKLANLRAYYGFMWAHPGKKLLFMGGEIAQPQEWNHDSELGWSLLDDPAHAGLQRLIRDLNTLVRGEPALHEQDHLPEGFQWVVGDDYTNSVFAFLRRGSGDGSTVLAVCNFTPVVRENYRVGVPSAGLWTERLNTDSAIYGGADVGNRGAVSADEVPAHGHAHSLLLTLPPLATLYLTAPSAHGRR